MASEWGFLLDENLDRDVANKLEGEAHRADLVVDCLEPGADYRDDVLPYAIEHDLIVVTKDVSDFDTLDDGDHEGIVLVYDHRSSAFEMANALLSIIDAYGDRDRLRHTEVLDEWL